MTTDVRYCFDTSAFIEPWVRHYPIQAFPGLWSSLEDLYVNNRLLSPDEVLVELARRSDEVHHWAKEHKKIFLPLDGEVQVAVSEILASHSRLVGNHATRNRADPFVIAMARVTGSVLVTYEGPGSPIRPKIPDVCAAYSVECITFVELILREGWVLG